VRVDCVVWKGREGAHFAFLLICIGFITRLWSMSRRLQSLIRLTRLALFESGFDLQFLYVLLWPNSSFCFLSFFSRILRREPALTQFETAQIANLCPADAEEAKSVIPRYAQCDIIHV
jgi:hypothetical protein